ncbi:hypothetical protein [Metabacillus indicus]|uniref:hypothetical protein n=1 Tax=Metabacillus indicus TaxID=246786 RepID=UPI003CE860B3
MAWAGEAKRRIVPSKSEKWHGQGKQSVESYPVRAKNGMDRVSKAMNRTQQERKMAWAG